MEQLRNDNSSCNVFKNHVLRVIDIGYSPETSDRVHKPCVDSEKVEEYLTSLPAQKPFTARLLLCGLDSSFQDGLPVRKPRPSIAPSAKQVVLNSYMRILGVDKMDLPAIPETPNLIEIAQQWKIKQNTTWLAAKPLSLDEEKWAFMTCSPVGIDKVVGKYSFPKQEISH